MFGFLFRFVFCFGLCGFFWFGVFFWGGGRGGVGCLVWLVFLFLLNISREIAVLPALVWFEDCNLKICDYSKIGYSNLFHSLMSSYPGNAAVPNEIFALVVSFQNVQLGFKDKHLLLGQTMC